MRVRITDTENGWRIIVNHESALKKVKYNWNILRELFFRLPLEGAQHTHKHSENSQALHKGLSQDSNADARLSGRCANH